MTLHRLLYALGEIGARVTTHGGMLKVSAPEGALTTELKRAIQLYKPDLMNLPEPRLDRRGDLHIPIDCAPQYRWWHRGQSVAETLTELGASEDVWRRYTSDPHPGVTRVATMTRPLEMAR